MRPAILGILCLVITAACGSTLRSAQAKEKSADPLPVAPWPDEDPTLPKSKGWYRYLGEQAYAAGLAVGPSVVVVQSQGKMMAFGKADGALKWSIKCATRGYFFETATWFDAAPLVTAGAVYFQDGPAMQAVDAGTGAELFQKQNLLPLAQASSGELWCARRGTDFKTANDRRNYVAIELIDAATGKQLGQFNTGTILGWGGSLDAQLSPTLLVRTVEGVEVLQSDGTRRLLKLGIPYNSADLAVVGENLVLVDTFSRLSAILKAEDQVRDDYSFPQVMGLYSLADGRPLWERRKFEGGSGDFPHAATFSSDLIVLTATGGYAAYDLHSGKLLRQQAGEMEFGNDTWCEADGEYVLWDSTASKKHMQGILRTNPRSGKDMLVLSANKQQFKDWAVSGDQLFVSFTSGADGKGQWDAAGYWGFHNHLLALDLRNGGPITGTVQKLDKQPSAQASFDSFNQEADPIANQDLMSRIGAAGVNTFLSTLKRFDQLDTAHRSALAYWATGLDSRYREMRGADAQNRATDTLMDVLRLRQDPALSPIVIAWLNDPTLAAVHQRLLGVLASCGGSVSASFLAGAYTSIDPQRQIQRLAPQYTLQPQKPYYSDIGTQAHQQTAWSETDLDGAHYVAYTASGLLSERDIYLAIDANGDKQYEEVLPTGLTDVFEAYSFPGGAAPIGKKGALTLTATNDGLAVTHHVPPEVTSNGEKDWDVEQAQLTITPLDLAQLRRDSDTDGLSDIAEEAFFTKPDLIDSDGDGIADGRDPTPNVDPRSMGKVERGVGRALEYFFNDEETAGDFSAWLEPDPSGHPWKAVYLDVNGCGPVAFAPNESVPTVCITTAAQRAEVAEHMRGFPGFRVAGINLAGPGIKDDSPTAGMAALYLKGASCPYVVTIDMTWLGFAVFLKEIDGELYPVEARMTWIS